MTSNYIPHDNFSDVGRFHAKFGLHSVSHTQPGPAEMSRVELTNMLFFRAGFLLEEVLEFLEACGIRLHYDPEEGGYNLERTENVDNIDHAKAFDALIDEVYVAMGTAHLLGYPWQSGWDEVQSANMSKERAKLASDSKRGSTLDVIKPPGWKPPNIAAVLRRFGFKVNEENE